MTNNTWEVVGEMIKQRLNEGKITQKDKDLILRTLSSKKHIQMDNKMQAKRDLLEAEESLIETEVLVDKISNLEVI